MHRNKPSDKTWNEYCKEVNVDPKDLWLEAWRDMLKLLFEDEPGAPHEGLSRQEPSHYDRINAHLKVLLDIIQHASSPQRWTYRTRFGDKKLPCDLCTQNRYSKLQPQENLATLHKLFGCKDEKGDFEERLDDLNADDQGDCDYLYLELHTYLLDAQTTEKHDVRAALKAYFSDGEWDESEVDRVTLRLYLSSHFFPDGQERTQDLERGIWARFLKTIKTDLTDLERQRFEFKMECEKMTPLFRDLLGKFKSLV